MALNFPWNRHRRCRSRERRHTTGRQAALTVSSMARTQGRRQARPRSASFLRLSNSRPISQPVPVGGCVGCRDGVALIGVLYDTDTGESNDVYFEESGYRLHLDPTSLDTNGTFLGQELRLAHPAISINNTAGAWGGQFSNIADSAGDPRLLAGTFGAEATSAGGSETTFLGSFRRHKGIGTSFLRSTDAGTVDHLYIAVVGLHGRVHQAIPDAPPPIEAVVAGRVRPITRRQVPPRSAGAKSTHKIPFRTRRSSTPATPRGWFGNSGSIAFHSKSVRS